MKRFNSLIILSVIPMATFVITGITFHIPWWQILLGGVIVYIATSGLIIGLIRIVEYMFDEIDETDF